MKYAFMILGIWLLMGAACKTTDEGVVLTVEKQVVFIPDSRFEKCPVLRDFPEVTTLTEGQIGELLVLLDSYNRTCHRNFKAYRNELNKAKKALEDG